MPAAFHVCSPSALTSSLCRLVVLWHVYTPPPVMAVVTRWAGVAEGADLPSGGSALGRSRPVPGRGSVQRVCTRSTSIDRYFINFCEKSTCRHECYCCNMTKMAWSALETASVARTKVWFFGAFPSVTTPPPRLSQRGLLPPRRCENHFSSFCVQIASLSGCFFSHLF